MTFEEAVRLIATERDGPTLTGTAHVAARQQPAEVIAALEKRLASTPKDDDLRVELLSLIAAIAEIRGRRERGLSTINGVSHTDLGYSFAREELAKVRDAAGEALQRTGTANMAIALAESYIGLGDLAEAERIYAILRAENVDALTNCTTFDKAFHLSLPAEAERGFGYFPPVHTLMGRTEPFCDRVVWVACDLRYFERFGGELLASFIAHRGAAKLALHIMDPDGEENSLLQRLQPHAAHIYEVTTEQTGRQGQAARAYYHAVRFIRFYQFLKTSTGTVWLWDADTIVGKSIAPLFDAMTGSDVGTLIFPGRRQPRNMIAAGYACACATPGALDYFGRVAAYIAHFAQNDKLAWGIDQVALYTCLVRTTRKLRVMPVPDHIAGRADAILLAAK